MSSELRAAETIFNSDLRQPKQYDNHDSCLRALARMTPAQRLDQAFELSTLTRDLFFRGLRQRFPELPPTELQALFRQRLELCHNANY